MGGTRLRISGREIRIERQMIAGRVEYYIDGEPATEEAVRVLIGPA